MKTEAGRRKRTDEAAGAKKRKPGAEKREAEAMIGRGAGAEAMRRQREAKVETAEKKENQKI